MFRWMFKNIIQVKLRWLVIWISWLKIEVNGGDENNFFISNLTADEALKSRHRFSWEMENDENHAECEMWGKCISFKSTHTLKKMWI